ncbi:hypothetical protein AQJ46_47640 [Streptomyces canus]|uniref:Uncharacterized protein n=1 Tax=Streptomyces canus TaxID=58343 RepID=A0A117QW50_9ACTN|nr:hypothetical protein AQJ46_47640 [Streptomyces canus]
MAGAFGRIVVEVVMTTSTTQGCPSTRPRPSVVRAVTVLFRPRVAVREAGRVLSGRRAASR